MTTPTWTEQQTAFWTAAGDARHEAERLAHQLRVLGVETDTGDTVAVRRRTNAALAVGRRLRELLEQLERSRP